MTRRQAELLAEALHELETYLAHFQVAPENADPQVFRAYKKLEKLWNGVQIGPASDIPPNPGLSQGI